MTRTLLLTLCLFGASCLSVDLEDRPCADDSECLDTHRCAAGKCRPGVATSATLTAPDFCHSVYPDEAAAALDAGDEVLLFGTLLPTSGANESKGKAREKAVHVALDELTNLGGVNQAEVGVISCDSAGEPVQATEAATFLAEYAQVPATIGAALSSVTLEAFQDGAEPAGMLMISPSATSPFLSGLSDLLWRTAPSDAFQGVAIARVLLDQGVSSVAVVSTDDAYGEGLRAVVREEWCVPDGNTDLCQADSTRYITRGFPASGDANADQDEAVSDLAGFDPDAIVVAAQLDGVISFLQKLSGTTLAGKLIVLPDAAKNDQLLDVDDAALLGNVLGTGPATPTGAVYGAFADSYGEDPPAFTPNAYDAMWMLALSAGVADEELSGEVIRDGLRRLSGGATEVAAGPTDFRSGLQVLENDPVVTVDFQGASGPLDFPTGETEAPADVGGWYVEGGAIVDYTTVVYDAATGMVTNPLAE